MAVLFQGSVFVEVDRPLRLVLVRDIALGSRGERGEGVGGWGPTIQLVLKVHRRVYKAVKLK